MWERLKVSQICRFWMPVFILVFKWINAVCMLLLCTFFLLLNCTNFTLEYVISSAVFLNFDFQTCVFSFMWYAYNDEVQETQMKCPWSHLISVFFFLYSFLCYLLYVLSPNPTRANNSHHSCPSLPLSACVPPVSPLLFTVILLHPSSRCPIFPPSYFSSISMVQLINLSWQFRLHFKYNGNCRCVRGNITDKQ